MGIIVRPTVQLGLDLQYPLLGPHTSQRPVHSVFTSVLPAFQHFRYRLAGPLRHVTGFPGLGLLRGLRPTRCHQSTTGLPFRRAGCPAVRATTDGSHVHLQSIGQGGAQLYPGSIATATPQTFTVASPPVVTSRLRSSPPTHSGAGHALQPAHIRQI